MDVFRLNGAQIEGGGAYWTAREILQQPQIWQQVEALLCGRQADALAQFLAPWLARADTRIILTGAGSSAYIGECLAPALSQSLHRRVEALATTDLVAAPGECLLPDAPTLLVSFGRSGNSPESLAAVELTEQRVRSRAHLIVTCDANGALGRFGRSAPSAHVLVLPEASNDRSFAMTSSFTGMLLTGYLALRTPLRPARSALYAALAAQLLPRTVPLLRELTARSFRRVVYLGSGPLKGLAREAALKMLELTDGRMVAVSESPLGFRHGPKTIVDAQTLVVLFVSNDRHTRLYDLDLLRELRQDGIAGRVLSLRCDGNAAAGPDDLVLSVPAEWDSQPPSDLELCLPYAVFAQSLALLNSVALGLQPDRPNATGIVNRVVQGVTIHPWQGGR